MRNLHNIEPALPSKPYSYIGYDADGTLYQIRRTSRRTWEARTPDCVTFSYAETLTRLASQLATLGKAR